MLQGFEKVSDHIRSLFIERLAFSIDCAQFISSTP